MNANTYQPMTAEIRCLIRGLALSYGHVTVESDTSWAVGSDWDAYSLDLAMLETELALQQELHPDAGLSCGPRKVHVAGDNFWAKDGIHVLHFGAYGCTHVLAFGSLCDALEDAAAVLRDVAPGCFTEPDYPENVQYDPSGEDSEANRLIEEAEQDLTYTESGYIASWEWAATSFDSLPEFLEWASGR